MLTNETLLFVLNKIKRKLLFIFMVTLYNKCSHNRTLSIFKVQIRPTFFFDTEVRDGYNYTAQPKISFILRDICIHQGAAFKCEVLKSRLNARSRLLSLSRLRVTL